MEWNAESVLDALNDFERKPEINPILEEYLQRIAKNGEIVFPWSKLKPLLKKKLEVVLDEFYETCPVETSVPVPNFETFNYENLKKTILQAVEAFTSAPFTIQRLCELVTNPQKHYNRTDKYMRGIEKNVLVVSTIEPRSGAPGEGNNANNNVIVNGLIGDSPRDDNDALNGHESESGDSVSSSNLNTPSNHVLLENFANVFPSAACIPSASNICINREIDNNFISTTECVDSQEEGGFDTSATSSEQTNRSASEDKEEAMDTSEEETSSNASVDSSDVAPGEACDSAEEREVEECKRESDSLENDVEPKKADSDEMEDVTDAEKSDIEPDSSNISEEISSEEEVKSNEECSPSEQCDSVSRSDEISSDSVDDDSSEAAVKQEEEIPKNAEPSISEAPDSESALRDSEGVSECSSLSDSESHSEQSMELEPEKASDSSPE